MNNQNHGEKRFFKEQVIERLDNINKEINMLNFKHHEINQKLDSLIDFLERKEQNRGYILGSWKTEFKKE